MDGVYQQLWTVEFFLVERTSGQSLGQRYQECYQDTLLTEQNSGEIMLITLGCVAIYSACQLSQGGYIAAGRTASQGFLIKYAPETGISEPDPPGVLSLNVSPNPCSSVLSVSFALPEPGIASVRVYDLSGRLISTITGGSFPAGSSTVEWVVPERLSSGCYLIQYNCDAGSIAEPVLLIK